MSSGLYFNGDIENSQIVVYGKFFEDGYWSVKEVKLLSLDLSNLKCDYNDLYEIKVTIEPVKYIKQ